MTMPDRSKRYPRHVRHDWREGVCWPQGTVRTLCGSTVANRNADIPFQKNTLTWCPRCLKEALRQAKSDLAKIEAMDLDAINSHFGISRVLAQKNHCLDIIIFAEPEVKKHEEAFQRRMQRRLEERRRQRASA